MPGRSLERAMLLAGLFILSCSGRQSAQKGSGTEAGGPLKEIVKEVQMGKGVEPAQPVAVAKRIQLNEGFQIFPEAQLAGSGENMAAAWIEFTDFPANQRQLMLSVVDYEGNFIRSKQGISTPTYGFNFLRLRWTGKSYVLLWTDDSRAVESCRKKTKDEMDCAIEHGWAWKSIHSAAVDGGGNITAKASVVAPESKVHDVKAALWQGTKVALLWTDLREDGECRKKDVFEGLEDPARWCYGGLHFTLLHTEEGSFSDDVLISNKKTILLNEPAAIFTGKRYVIAWQDGKEDKGLQCKNAVKQGAMPSGECRGDLFVTLLTDKGEIVEKAIQVTHVPGETTLSAFELLLIGQQVSVAWREGEEDTWRSKILAEGGAPGEGPSLSSDDLDKLREAGKTAGKKEEEEEQKITTPSMAATLGYAARKEEHVFENISDVFIDITFLSGSE